MSTTGEEKVRREPISIIAMPSIYEGFTTDVVVNGERRFSVDLEGIDERGILELVSGAIQLGSVLLLKDMGEFVNDASNEEH